MIKLVLTDIFGNTSSLKIIPQKFPNGELKIESIELNSMEILKTLLLFDKNTIHEDIFILKLLKRKYREKLTDQALMISFLAYSRMDREDGHHEHTLPLFLEELARLGFNRYTFVDPHNPNSLHSFRSDFNALYNIFYPAVMLVKNIMIDFKIDKDNFQIVLPDLGAKQKYSEVVESLEGSFHPACGAKSRNPETGFLQYNYIAGLGSVDNYIIVDDICSGGMTFKLCAEKILETNPNGRIFLVVSHFEEGGGKSILCSDSPITKIYTTDSMCDIKHEKIIQLELFGGRNGN